jgi:hypothetical protein
MIGLKREGDMKELLYFSFSDLLVKVEYSKEANSLKYSSHREISFGERVVIEQYLLTNIALKTDFYNRHPALFIYLGKDEKLVRELNLFHLKNTLKFLAGREKEVKEKVDELISSSMTNYYFERIGDAILELRKSLKLGKDNNDTEHNIMIVKETKEKMNELIKAYNSYSDKKISIENVVPNDLIDYFEYY